MSTRLPLHPRSFYGSRYQQIGQGGYGRVLVTEKDIVLKTTPNLDGAIAPSTVREMVSLLAINSLYVIPMIDLIFNRTSTSIVLPRGKESLQDNPSYAYLNPKRVVQQLCLGLLDIHQAGLVHLDLKPDNILIFPDQAIRIADFGLSRVHTCATQPIFPDTATIYYRPVEVSLHQSITDRVDVWSFGIILVELLMTHRSKTPYWRHLVDIGTNSNVDLLFFLFSIFGTPNEQTWPGITSILEQNFVGSIPQWKNTSRQYFLAKGLTEDEVDLATWILQLDPRKRPSIHQIAHHPWLELDQEVDPKSCLNQLDQDVTSWTNGWTHVEFRRRLMEGVVKLCYQLNLRMETLSLVIHLLDRVRVILSQLEDDEVNKYLPTCLYLSCCIYEDDLVSRRILKYIPDRTLIQQVVSVASSELTATTSYLYLVVIAPEQTEAWVDLISTQDAFQPPRQLVDSLLTLQ